MCFPQLESSNEEESQVVEFQTTLLFTNMNLTNAFLQAPVDLLQNLLIEEDEQPLPIEEDEQHLELTHTTYNISNAPTIYIQALANFIEGNFEYMVEDYIDECEIQTILRQGY